MLYNLLASKLSDKYIVLIASAVAFLVTFALMAKPFKFLPRDGGKFVTDKDGNKVEVNAASNGKVTGVGIIMVIVWLAMTLLFLPINIKTQTDYIIFLALSFVMMLTGYLDDAAKAPWGELIKGVLDFALALAAAIVFVIYNPTDITFFGATFHLPVVVYVILAVILIWASINVTNCSDGVDGLCGTVTVIEIFAYSFIFSGVEMFSKYSAAGTVLSFVLVGYLAYNWNPSTVLMGDAGSRAIGFYLALLAMKTGHPYAFILMSFVFLFDGGLGLLKLAVLRVFKVNLFKNVRFPFHDQLKKNKGWRVPNVVILFAFIQIVFSVITGVIIHVCK